MKGWDKHYSRMIMSRENNTNKVFCKYFISIYVSILDYEAHSYYIRSYIIKRTLVEVMMSLIIVFALIVIVSCEEPKTTSISDTPVPPLEEPVSL